MLVYIKELVMYLYTEYLLLRNIHVTRKIKRGKEASNLISTRAFSDKKLSIFSVPLRY